MGMNLSQFARFMQRVDSTFEALFPGIIRIAGEEIACTCVGGRSMLEYLNDGGQAPAGTIFFRVRKDLLATRPETGTRIEWVASPTAVTRLTIMECPDRPHETSWVLQCEPSDR